MVGNRPSATMADVARRAGVSKALVSIVLREAPGASEDSRARVMRAALELDYRPDHRARLLGRGRSRTIGVTFGLQQEFHGELLEAMYAEVEAAGWDLALGPTAVTRTEQKAVRGLLEQRCEVVILLGSELSRPDVEELAERVPLVLGAREVRRRPGGPNFDQVRSDDVQGAELAAGHLIGLGHRDILHIHGGRAPGTDERRRGFSRAMIRAGLRDRQQIVPGGLDEEAGERAATSLLRDRGSLPSAVMAFNDHCAVGVLQVLRAAGRRVPEEVSLVGYDDSRVAGLASVSLTTVRQDSGALAEGLVQLALARAESPGSESRDVVVPPALVVRSSTSTPTIEMRTKSPNIRM